MEPRVLLSYNDYQLIGGENRSYEMNLDMLRRNGIHTDIYFRSNNELLNLSWKRMLSMIIEPSWSIRTVREVSKFIEENKPDVLHSFNFFPLISPSVLYTAKRFNIPVVQTLSNYRLLCANSYMIRNNMPCDLCMNVSPFKAIQFGCYRENRLQTIPVVIMQLVHRLLHTWQKSVDLFTVPSNFVKTRFVKYGFDEDKIVVHNDFIIDKSSHNKSTFSYGLFAGRFSAEKGLLILLEAWKKIRDIPLILVGEGPLREKMQSYIQENQMPNVRIESWKNPEELNKFIQNAAFLIFPSVWAETFGRSVIDAYSCGVPVIASKIGALQEIVEDGKTGFLFMPGNVEELYGKIRIMWDTPGLCEDFGEAGFRLFHSKYSDTTAFTRLLGIYTSLMEKKY